MSNTRNLYLARSNKAVEDLEGLQAYQDQEKREIEEHQEHPISYFVYPSASTRPAGPSENVEGEISAI